jgi:hypothetical protein
MMVVLPDPLGSTLPNSDPFGTSWPSRGTTTVRLSFKVTFRAEIAISTGCALL